MPAYQADKTLAKVIQGIPKELTNNVILVDDASTDNTVTLAKTLGLTVLQHPKNRGYGGNQKTCYTEALRQQADIVVMLHPDGQYDPSFIPQLIDPILQDTKTVVFGSRTNSWSGALRGGMPIWKLFSNIVLSALANLRTGKKLTEWHCGYRAYPGELLKASNYNSFEEGFIFDMQMSLTAIKLGYQIQEVPIPTKYFKEASSINFTHSVKYGFAFLKQLAAFQK